MSPQSLIILLNCPYNFLVIESSIINLIFSDVAPSMGKFLKKKMIFYKIKMTLNMICFFSQNDI